MTADILPVIVNVENHASNLKVLNVFGVAPGSLGRRAAFDQAVIADARIASFLKPPADPGYHFEIPQTSAGR